MNKEEASAIFETSTKDVHKFSIETPEKNQISGFICKSRGSRMGSLIIEYVNNRETLQYVQGMPKIQYLDEKDDLSVPFVLDKADGCFRGTQEVRLWDGTSKRIMDIVKNKEEAIVPSFNPDTNKIEPKKVIAWSKRQFEGYFLRIEIEDSPLIECTIDHPFYIEKDLKTQAQFLKEGDEVYTLCFDISQDIKEMIYGTLLGDSWLSKNKMKGFETSHCIDQKDYFDHKKSLLSNFGINERELKSGYGSKIFTFRAGVNKIKKIKSPFQEFYDVCYQDGKKKITQEWLDKLSAISLAYLYMDDGSLKTQKNEHNNSYQATIHTNSYSKEENILLIKELWNKFGINAGLFEDKRKNVFYIGISQNNSMHFFKIIAPYVLESMRYKLPKELKNVPYIPLNNSMKYNIEKAKVLKINKVETSKTHSKYARKPVRYAITVKDNHNYFAGNALVGNTNIVHFPLIDYQGNVIETLFKTRMMPTCQNKFQKLVDHVITDNHYRAVEKTKLSYSYELYGYENPHEVNYRFLDIPLKLDLITVLDQGKSLPYHQMLKKADKYDIDHLLNHWHVSKVPEGFSFIGIYEFLQRYEEFNDGLQPDFIAPTLREAYTELESFYERININYQKEHHGGIITEGAVWHYGTEENHMKKNKALSVREGHIKRACGIPHHDIRKAVKKAEENLDIFNEDKEKIVDFIKKELSEEYPDEMVKDIKADQKINSILTKMTRQIVIDDNLKNIVEVLNDEVGIEASPADKMRCFAQKYPDLRKMSRKVYQAVVSA